MPNTDNDLELSTPPPGVAYLGDLQVVSKILNDFAHGVLVATDDFNAGRITRDASITKIQELCRTTGKLFMGADPGFEPAPWHTFRLSGKIRALVPGVSGSADDVCAGYFEWIAQQLVSVSNAIHGGMADEEAGPTVQAGLRDALRFLLGA